MRNLESFVLGWRRALARRTPRERTALLVMACTIAGALWIQLLWTAHHARARYAAVIAESQSRIESMRLAAAAMAAARTQGPGVRPIGPDKSLAVIGDGLRVAGISGLGVLPDAQGRVRLSGTADFDAWTAWLARTHVEYGVQVLYAVVEPAGPAGMVKIEATIALPEAR